MRRNAVEAHLVGSGLSAGVKLRLTENSVLEACFLLSAAVLLADVIDQLPRAKTNPIQATGPDKVHQTPEE